MKEEFKSLQIKDLDKIANLIPALVYWLDTDGIVLGMNDLTCIKLGDIKLRDKVLGKRHEDFYPEHIAKTLNDNNRKVVELGKTIEFEEEVVNVETGVTQYFAAVRSPLRDDDGNVVGIIGSSIEITDKKVQEQLTNENVLLKLQSESQQAILEQQEKFQKEANQVAHDIRSPISSLLMILKACDEIPERPRIALREATNRINDIANNLISRHKNENTNQGHVDEARVPMLISTAMLEILTEKKYQYQNLSVKLDHHFSPAGNFAWINIKPTAFKRMVSNLINNAVDAFDNKPGNVSIGLDTNEDRVHIIIKDNGKGMSPELVQKIKNKVAVSEGKADGHGIGLTQVNDTLDGNEGTWEIKSQVGVGTTLILTFPRVEAQGWIADSVQLYDNDTVIVLDDDRSIHMAWDFRFADIRPNYPNLKIIHHEKGLDTIDFINCLSPEQKQEVFLCADYELLQQNLNGLQVIAESDVARSILVTSHYGQRKIQQEASKTGTRILPKQLAAEVPIHVGKRTAIDSDSAASDQGLKKVDFIFVDDEQYLLDSYRFLCGKKCVDTFSDPQEFLDQVGIYPKCTVIFLDQNFSNFDQKGTQIAEQLNEMGYSRLYLLTGAAICSDQTPNYLTILRKGNMEEMMAVLEG